MSIPNLLTFYEINEVGTYLVYYIRGSLEEMVKSPILFTLKVANKDGELVVNSIDGVKNVILGDSSSLSKYTKHKLLHSVFVGPLEDLIEYKDPDVQQRYWECVEFLNNIKQIKDIIE